MVRMNLILGGGGNSTESASIDKLFVNLIRHKSKEKCAVLYIPIAMPKKSHSFGECWDWFTDCFSKYKLDIDMWTYIGGRRYSELNRYGAVYIGGGITFNLLHEIKRTGFDYLLKRFVADKGIVYGGSAGAIILGNNITTAYFGRYPDVNRIGLRDLTGLNLLWGTSIVCHYTPKNDKKILNFVKKSGNNVVALTESNGLNVTEKGIRVLGDSNAILFTDKGKSCLKRGRVYHSFNLTSSRFL
jgi:dipeptidase E